MSDTATTKATHRCKICGALWALVYPKPEDPQYAVPLLRDGFWTWLGAPPPLGNCCNNRAMGDQIEALRHDH